MTDIYYDYGPILSHNSAFNFIVGARGMGKTYGAQKLCIKTFLEKGHQFIYLRRYKTELKGIADTFFTAVASEFPNHVFRCDGATLTVKRPGSDKAEIMGWVTALSGAGSKKSVAYPGVTRIVFDEFLLPVGHVRYLPNEYHTFLEFFNTVDRYQDRTTAIFIANGVDIANPYFLALNIVPKLGQMRRYKEGLVCVDFPRAEKYAAAAKKSRLGRLVAGTDYERYAIGNEFVSSETGLIARKPSTADYMWSIDHGGVEVSLWFDRPSIRWYVSRRKVRDSKAFVLSVREGDDSKVVLEPNDEYVRIMKQAYRYREMFFQDHQTHAAYQSILAFLNTR